jgi:hypothetical protein
MKICLEAVIRAEKHDGWRTPNGMRYTITHTISGKKKKNTVTKWLYSEQSFKFSVFNWNVLTAASKKLIIR